MEELNIYELKKLAENGSTDGSGEASPASITAAITYSVAQCLGWIEATIGITGFTIALSSHFSCGKNCK